MEPSPPPTSPFDGTDAVDADGRCPLDAAALARAVAAPGSRALYLDADRRPDGWGSVATAAASGRPFCVEPDSGLLVVDADKPGAALLVDELARMVRAAGAVAVVVESGSPGHRHLFARLGRAHRRRLATWGRAHGLDVRTGQGGRIRPPLSPHPAGLPVALLWPATPAEALAALDRSAPTEAEPLRWDDLLRSGRWPAGYGGADLSGSAMVFAIARGAARAGWTVDALEAALVDEANAGGAAYRKRHDERRPGAASRWLADRVWPAAVASAATWSTITCPADAAAELGWVQSCVEAERWRGVGGATERAFLLALVALGSALATVTPNRSHRQLAEDLGISRTTVAAAAARLMAKGWLQVASVGRGRTVATDTGELGEEALGTTWRLRVPPAVAERLPGPRAVRPPHRTDAGGPTKRVPHDAYRWRGLGLNAPRVVDALAAGPLTAAQLGACLRLDAGNLARRLLPKLASHGLLHRAEDGRWALAADVTAALDAAARALDLTGRGAAMADLHRRQREDYLEWRRDGRPERLKRRQAALEEARAQRRAAHDAARLAGQATLLAAA